MERLTARNDDGTAYFPECFKKNGCKGEGYKKNYCDFDIKICEKLAEYEDLEESGRLVKLPCVVGDTLYELRHFMSCEYGYNCPLDHSNGKNNCLKNLSCEHEQRKYCIVEKPFGLGLMIYAIGKTVFSTREAAEAKLKEMEGKE